MGAVQPLPGGYGEAQRWAIRATEKLIQDLEGQPDSDRLLREARAVLRQLRAPRPVKRVPKSEEVLRHQAGQLRLAVAVADATEQLGPEVRRRTRRATFESKVGDQQHHHTRKEPTP